MLLWGIWKGHCDHYHNKTSQVRDLQISVDWYYSLLDNYRTAQEQVNRNTGTLNSALCLMDQVRDDPFSTVYVDATYKEESLEFETGMLFSTQAD